MAKLSHDELIAAKATADALDAAVKARDWPSYLRFETAAVRLHRVFRGHHPGGGRTLDLAARAELKSGKPGKGCEAFAGYLARLAGAEFKSSPAPEKSPATSPVKSEPTKGK